MTAFRDRLVLNQRMLGLFGARTFEELAEPLRDPGLEGLDERGLHRFLDVVQERATVPPARVLAWEERIATHTRRLSEHREITWKYYQWLALLFTEAFLEAYFDGRETQNKLCLQCATGSGKTLLMHANLLQFREHAPPLAPGALSRVILLTPNERLSEQHLAELAASGIRAGRFSPSADHEVDVLEITKLADVDGPQQIATRSLGDRNLLLVDEGHRGMSGREEGAWFTRRNALCARGFAFEYSATFEQAVAASGSDSIAESYAGSVLFDYGYRSFYRDGFGKDYRILNLPRAPHETRDLYMTACLLRFHQQLRLYDEHRETLRPFHLSRPLWVFVGSSVRRATGSKDDRAVASDVARVLQFIADFLHHGDAARRRIASLLSRTGAETGLVDESGRDIFDGAFEHLAGLDPDELYRDILQRLFRGNGGGLRLTRIAGDAGEIALHCGSSSEPFGLVNVGDAKGLCDHCRDVCRHVTIGESVFSRSMFAGVRDADSPVTLLVGSKKFIEGWDCWRVSTMGLMHVGKREGTQVVQLFGRGVRLQGWRRSLKRSVFSAAPVIPDAIGPLETLNVFGVEADFMQRFREYLRVEGLPANEVRQVAVPQSRPAPGPARTTPVNVGEIPPGLRRRPVVCDWYPRIEAIASDGEPAAEASRHEAVLGPGHVAMLDLETLYFDLERYKQQRGWHYLNVTADGIRTLLADPAWYRLLLPASALTPGSYEDVRNWQKIAGELLRRYAGRLYAGDDVRESVHVEPRVEVGRALSARR